MRYGVMAPPVTINNGVLTLDPQVSYYSQEFGIMNLLFEGLTRRTAKGEIVGGAAEKWESNADQSVWTFTLRKGLKYSDGSPLNAKRFEYSLLRLINPATEANSSNHLLIAGAMDWSNAVYGEDAGSKDAAKKAKADADAKSAEATARDAIQALGTDGKPCADYKQEGCLTLRIKLESPVPHWATLMSSVATYPAKEESITKSKDWSSDAALLVGNGAFSVKAINAQGKSVFEANPYYSGPKPKLSSFELIAYKDVLSLMNAYKGNQLDMASLAGATGDEYRTLRAQSDLMKDLVSYAGTCSYIIGYRSMVKPFDDPKVRQAFSYALDRERLVKEGFGDFSKPATGWIPPTMPGSDPNDKRFAFNPDMARKMIAESSYKTVANLPPIVMGHSDYAENDPLFNFYVAQFKEVFPGLRISHVGLPSQDIIAKLRDPESGIGMFQTNSCADVGDISEWGVYWQEGSSASVRTGFNDKKFNDALEQALGELDATKRIARFKQANDILIDWQPAAFAAVFSNDALIKPWVGGVTPIAMDVIPGEYDRANWDINTVEIKPVTSLANIEIAPKPFAAKETVIVNAEQIIKSFDLQVQTGKFKIQSIAVNDAQIRIPMTFLFSRSVEWSSKINSDAIYIMDGNQKLMPLVYEGILAKSELIQGGEGREGALIFARPKNNKFKLFYPTTDPLEITLKK